MLSLADQNVKDVAFDISARSIPVMVLVAELRTLKRVMTEFSKDPLTAFIIVSVLYIITRRMRGVIFNLDHKCPIIQIQILNMKKIIRCFFSYRMDEYPATRLLDKKRFRLQYECRNYANKI